MPNDPIGMLAAQMNTAFSEFNRNFSQINAEMLGMVTNQLQSLNDMAPHNVFGKMGQGSGTFSAKMTTKDLDDRNIFGGGG